MNKVLYIDKRMDGITMSYATTLKEIQANKLESVYVFHGTEEYFIQNLKLAVVKQLVPVTDEEVFHYDLEETPIEDVIIDLETYPFFTEHKLIIAEHPHFLQAGQKKSRVEHQTAALERYIEHPVPYATLILIGAYEKLDQRKKIVKALQKQTKVVACNPIRDRELYKWIEQIAQDLHITIDRDVFEVLEAALSTNLFLLQSELQKLALFVGEGGHVSRAIAEELVARSTESSALKLVDAVLNKNLEQAIRIFNDLLKMNEEPIALIGLLSFQFRTILRVKLLQAKGYTEKQMQKQISVHPFVIKLAYTRQRSMRKEDLERIMIELAETDAAIKTGTMDKTLAFELLLYNLIK